MTLGNNIKKYRKMFKLSQEDLAKKSNLSRNAIYNYENNKRQPSIFTLNKIAAALGVTVNDLLEESESKNYVELDYLSEYIKTLGYKIDGDLVEGYLVINSPVGTYEITQKDIDDLNISIKSFVLFKLQEIINHSRKIGK